MFVKNGFQNVAEKIKVGRFILERLTSADVEKYSTAERLRMSFEELGPTFVKLGQLLASRPDLIPEDFVEELKKLHDQVATIPFSEVRNVLELHFGARLDDVFESIEEQPLGSASIAQVHRAILKDGKKVVVKVQRPGIERIINEDVGILYYLADLLQKFVPETRPFNPVGMVDELFRTLELETNFIVEANNIRRFVDNFRDDPTIKIPEVYFQYSGRRVLVLEMLEGIPLSQKHALAQEGIDRQTVMRVGLKAYFKQVFKDGVFHGDLHAGNIFILPDNRIGMVDFGIVGRLNRRTQDAIANMFVSLYQEDYERLAYEYVEVSPYNEFVDVDHFAKDLQNLLAPYFGLTLKNVDLGRLLLDSTAVAAKHRLVLPSELMLFFKSIVTVEGMGRFIAPDFNLLDYAMEFAAELVRTKYSPDRVKEDLFILGRDSSALFKALPRQLRQFTRKVGHPDFAFRHRIADTEEIKRTVERSSNILFLGMIISALILSASWTMSLSNQPWFLGIPAVSALLFGFAGVLGLVAFYNYMKS
ncbi:MAG TPA: AarF/ABC1/UbiB kinase family protein [Bdellovibrionales bacterium]|nr:AarF/ABC1/UbiB kinase family protein [Bdellovibrionales bacterium]